MTLCGGTGDVQEATDEVQALVNQLKDKISDVLGHTPDNIEATHFKTQVVAGINYFVRAHIGNDNHVHLRIYKHFSGTVDLHGVKHGVGADEELQYFDQNVGN